MIARTPVSNGSQVPGGRRPGRASSSGPIVGSPARWLAGSSSSKSRLAMRRELLDHVHQLLPVREVRAEQKVVVAARRDLEHAGVVADDDRAAVRAPGDLLDAGDGACREVGGHRVPVERAAERKAQQQAPVGDQTVGFPAPRAKLARRLPEDLATRAVELAQAAEARGVGDLGDREIGVVEQPPREVRPGRARQPVGGDSHVRLEQASKVSGRDTKPGPEIGFAPVIQHRRRGSGSPPGRPAPAPSSRRTAASGRGGSDGMRGSRRPRPRRRTGTRARSPRSAAPSSLAGSRCRS